MVRSKSVLVTGGTGNIGSAVVTELLQHDYRVSVLCRSEKSENSARLMGAEVVSGGINEPAAWLEELENFDALIHAACGFGQDMGPIDVQFMKKITQHSSKRLSPLILIYTSGCWVYGNSEQIISEQTAKNPLPEFQWMQWSIDFLQAQSTIDLRVVSPANVVSKAQKSIPLILHWELDRCDQPCIPSIPQLSWSLVERNNLAELYRLVLEKGRRGEEYIGSGQAKVNVAELAGHLSPLPIKEVPIDEWREHYGAWTEGYAMKQVFSSKKATTELGWKPRLVFTD
ncbi:MAG: NAD-dependent epimerase/dehydratase family protein [Thiotrichaceae bacterium]|nr:NAD-dependent epimerase/dehydratase family protein [Thiotrichaceae bacterium]